MTLPFIGKGTLQFLKELTNVTKSVGDTVKLRCEVKNLDANPSKVAIKWKLNYASIIESKRIKVFTVSYKQRA